MFHEEQRRGGGLPNDYRNAIAWRWAPDLPRQLCGGVLTMLYVVASMADATGRLRFTADHRPIRLASIARAARCDPKDGRRYLDALVAAGVLAVEGQQGRGRTPTYILVLAPRPDWQAAVNVLKQTRRERGERGVTAPKPAPENGGHPPNQTGDTPASSPPGTGHGSGDTPATRTGDTPRDFRGQPPEHPREPRDLPQEMADVPEQPSGDARASPSPRHDIRSASIRLLQLDADYVAQLTDQARHDLGETATRDQILIRAAELADQPTSGPRTSDTERRIA